MKIFLLAIAALCNLNCFSQNYKQTDDYVKSLGSLDSLNIATITDTLTYKFAKKEEKARAIFYWVANNISLDLKAAKGNDRKATVLQIIETRKANSLGFSLLVQEMMSQANIRCLSVDGYVKTEIDDVPDEPNASWNVVQLGTSPTEWYYVDAAMAAGYADKRFTTFTKEFTGEFFFSDRVAFNLIHFPDNTAWLLGPGAKSVKEFYSQPVIHNAAIIYNLQKISPVKGLIKTRLKDKTDFRLEFISTPVVSDVSMLVGDAKRSPKAYKMEYKTAGNVIEFSFQFKIDSDYPFQILIDGKPLATYKADVRE